MASKTKMFQLLRLLDRGAIQPDIVEAAADCWQALPLDTKKQMIIAGNADSRRARIWKAAYLSGIKHVFDEWDLRIEEETA